MVQEVCRTMLFRQRLKPGVPVSRTDLIKNMTMTVRHATSLHALINLEVVYQYNLGVRSVSS